MNDKAKIIIVAVIVLLIIWWFTRKKNDTATLAPGEETLFLTTGSSGDLVKKLQLKLNEQIRKAVKRNANLYCQYEPNMEPWLVGELTVDGIFGPRTMCALKAITGKTGIYAGEIDSINLVIPANTDTLDQIKWD